MITQNGYTGYQIPYKNRHHFDYIYCISHGFWFGEEVLDSEDNSKKLLPAELVINLLFVLVPTNNVTLCKNVPVDDLQSN